MAIERLIPVQRFNCCLDSGVEMSHPIDFTLITRRHTATSRPQNDELAAKYGRSVSWKPILLGVVFRSPAHRCRVCH
jgi:hypothetical protein